mgnify:CR=1 FL=1
MNMNKNTPRLIAPSVAVALTAPVMAKDLTVISFGGANKDAQTGMSVTCTKDTPYAIGLDNDGLDHFLDHHLPYLRTVGCPIILNIAAKAAESAGCAST